MPIPLIEVSGPPRERGRAYGEAARAEIAMSLAYYREAFAVSPGLAWPEVCGRARAWRGIVEAAAPHLVEEMDGIAEGAGIGPDDCCLQRPAPGWDPGRVVELRAAFAM
jgi:isopenicillin-N N-acyltransferase-like protein